MGMEHVLATSCPVFVHAMLHGEWMRARLRLHDMVYISLLGPRPRLTRPSVTVYDIGADLLRPHRLTVPRPTHLSELPLMLRSSLLSVSRSLVYINMPGRTCLHELFIEYEQVTAWVAKFSFNKMKANYHILSTVVCTGWPSGQAHKSPPLQFG